MYKWEYICKCILRFLFPKHIKIIQIYSSDFVSYMIIVFLLCAGMIGLRRKEHDGEDSAWE